MNELLDLATDTCRARVYNFRQKVRKEIESAKLKEPYIQEYVDKRTLEEFGCNPSIKLYRGLWFPKEETVPSITHPGRFWTTDKALAQSYAKIAGERGIEKLFEVEVKLAELINPTKTTEIFSEGGAKWEHVILSKELQSKSREVSAMPPELPGFVPFLLLGVGLLFLRSLTRNGRGAYP